MTKEASYTPGPWHVGQDSEAGLGQGYFIGGGGYVRANVVGPVGPQKANARLIAAAPEMFEAATKLRNAQRAYMADRGNEALGKAVGEAAQELDAVLAKAKGG